MNPKETPVTRKKCLQIAEDGYYEKLSSFIDTVCCVYDYKQMDGKALFTNFINDTHNIEKGKEPAAVVPGYTIDYINNEMPKRIYGEPETGESAVKYTEFYNKEREKSDQKEIQQMEIRAGTVDISISIKQKPAKYAAIPLNKKMQMAKSEMPEITAKETTLHTKNASLTIGNI